VTPEPAPTPEGEDAVARERRIAEALACADLRPLARAFIAAALEVRAQELDKQPGSSPRGRQTKPPGGY
jgi:hypothetical protein